MTKPLAVFDKKHPEDIWTEEDIIKDCPLCGAHAIVKLTPRLLALQPDGTTLVCHPGFGGCNTGFELDATISPPSKAEGQVLAFPGKSKKKR